MIKMHTTEDTYADKAKYFKSIIDKPPWKRTASELKEVSKIVKEIPFIKSKVSLGEADIQYLIHHFRHRNYKQVMTSLNTVKL